MNDSKAYVSDVIGIRSIPVFNFLLMRVYNACFEAGEMCDCMKTSNTRVIFKKGDLKALKNLRPISLLNVDYKICSEAISVRLSKVLDFIVDPDQTCSVPDHRISSNLHILSTFLEIFSIILIARMKLGFWSVLIRRRPLIG